MSLKYTYISHTIQDTQQLAVILAQLIKAHDLFYLEGELGTGKTTLVQFIVKSLNQSAKVTSPTFSLVQSYDTNIGDIYHIDLYRIKAESEIQNLGLEEIFNFYPCFVEWASKLGKYSADFEAITITIKNVNQSTREFMLNIPESYQHYAKLITLLQPLSRK